MFAQAVVLGLLPSFARYALALNVPASFENTAVVRQVDLGGTLSSATTTYTFRALADGAQEYVVTLSKDEGDKTSWFVPKLKGSDVELPAAQGFDAADQVYYYKIALPTPLKRDETETLNVATLFSHASTPWPPTAAQKDPVRLNFEADMLLISPYETLSQRTKIRTPTPNVGAFSDPSPPSIYAKDAQATKSGSTVTYGPFASVPPSLSDEFRKEHQRRISVKYETSSAVASIISLHRAAEISHWGANLNIQDDIHLKNGGPTLKGHFSRVEHQHTTYYTQQAPPSTLWWMTLQLPPGIHSPYFIDQNGNVSTSRFRPSPSVPQDQSPFLNPKALDGLKPGTRASKFSTLEIRPRYPVVGGWNYTFRLGWDAPLNDWASYDRKSGKHIVAVPFLNTFKDVAVNDAELKIILPEGAIDVEVFPPFPVDSVEHSTHVTFLDTVGRPAVTLKKRQVTDKHDGIVYVSYAVPFSAHLKKPLAVSVATVGLFIFAFVARRIDPRIHTTAASK
ncbi:Ribophorin I [Exidia glandulosa HHB12029]|uniref:Dolichyl-diphosphooligosaccharide--protein glycosyltransferase subunit 1 n=1 Tax=Exidia glandulosa HHB12029 TaxID=1314781 RepID=A0A165PFJ5_EXIGL|nr:Ribophorin I [Exidia glandulosa HHB12029]